MNPSKTKYICAVVALLVAGLISIDGLALRGARATGTYANLGTAPLNFGISPATLNLIQTNDDWSGVASVEGYFGQNLTATHGVDPQTVLTAEFANSQLPSSPTHVSANKGNPSAFNAGGIAEFDTGTYLSVGLQGNVQANPYLVFYANTLNRSAVTVGYEVTDIDSGNNNSVSRLALQYRVGNSGPFTNVPAGYVADATDGPNVGGRVTTRSVLLPADCYNQPQVQIRLLTTNAANGSGSSTPDEWIGINNVVVSSSGSSAASVSVSGRVTNYAGRGLGKVGVTLQASDGSFRYALTNPLGYYSFEDVAAGESYLVSVASKGYQFNDPARLVNLDDAIANVDFVAN
jgi:uncharacterized protein